MQPASGDYSPYVGMWQGFLRDPGPSTDAVLIVNRHAAFDSTAFKSLFSGRRVRCLKILSNGEVRPMHRAIGLGEAQVRAPHTLAENV